MKLRIVKYAICASLLLLFAYLLISSLQTDSLKETLDIEGEWIDLPTKTHEITSIVFAKGLFVGVGGGLITSSKDGVNWSIHLEHPGGGQELFNKVIYNDGRFVAVGNKMIVTSLDGVNWSKAVTGIINDLASIAYGNGFFVAVGSRGVMRSEDGITWNNNGNDSYSSICYGNGQFIAVGPWHASRSTDGVFWEDVSIPQRAGGGYLQTVAYGEGQYIAIGGRDDLGSVIWSSADGQIWKDIKRVKDHFGNGIYMNGRFFFSGGRSLIYSKDGRDWDSKSLPQDISLRDIAYGNNKYILTAIKGWKQPYPVPPATVLIMDESQLENN